MAIVAVDLAAKYSAACWFNDEGRIVGQWDSWQKTETEFISVIVSPWGSGVYDDADLLAVEDLPHGVGYRTLVKDVCRLQGRIVDRMKMMGHGDRVLFVPPTEWRRYFGLKQGQGQEDINATARANGFLQPDLTDRIDGKGQRAIARKVSGDYCAAFLLGMYILHYYRVNASYDAPRTSRYLKD